MVRRQVVWFALTIAVASAFMTIQELADHTGSTLSHLAKSYLGVERVASEIKPTDFSTPNSFDGLNFVEQIARTTSAKITKRMEQVICMSPNASNALSLLLMVHRK